MKEDRSKDRQRDQGRTGDDHKKNVPSDWNYSEESHKDHYIVDTLKPPPRPDGGKGNGGRS